MTMFALLHENGNDLTDHDLAHLAEWANNTKEYTPNPSWKRAYALIREGADLLLRRRAMSSAAEDEERKLSCWQEFAVKKLSPTAYAAHNASQGWLILEAGSTLNIASFPGARPYNTEEEAWHSAYKNKAEHARTKQLRKWPEAHALKVGQLGWMVLGTADVADADSVAYRYPLAITHNCTFCETEEAAWLDADERDAKGHPMWNPNRATGSTRETDEHNAAVDARPTQ